MPDGKRNDENNCLKFLAVPVSKRMKIIHPEFLIMPDGKMNDENNCIKFLLMLHT